MQLPFLPLTLTSGAPKQPRPELSREELQRRVDQRGKDIFRTKQRQSYKDYVGRVPSAQRDPNMPKEHPTTPDTNPRSISRRGWQATVNSWKRRLQELHTEHEDTEPRVESSTTEDSELLRGGANEYDSDDLDKDMAVLAMDKPKAASPPLTYPNLVRGNNASSPSSDSEPQPKPRAWKKRWADYTSSDDSDLESAPAPAPAPATTPPFP